MWPITDGCGANLKRVKPPEARKPTTPKKLSDEKKWQKRSRGYKFSTSHLNFGPVKRAYRPGPLRGPRSQSIRSPATNQPGDGRNQMGIRSAKNICSNHIVRQLAKRVKQPSLDLHRSRRDRGANRRSLQLLLLATLGFFPSYLVCLLLISRAPCTKVMNLHQRCRRRPHCSTRYALRLLWRVSPTTRAGTPATTAKSGTSL